MVILLYLLLIFSFVSGHVFAVDFYGSDPLGSTGLNVAPGVDLLNTGQFALTQVFANPGTGDFSSIPNFMILTPEEWLIDFNDLSNLSIGHEGFGTFTASGSEIVSRTADFVNVQITGLFSHTLVDDTTATLQFAMTQTGQSISWGGTLSVGSAQSPNLVPEPASAAVGLIGFLGLFIIIRRHRR